MGFLAPWFLAGLAGLGIPVFVHLLRKHITVPRPVSSLMFFERGTQSSTKHHRLRYLLLFALRFALLLLVVLAFANPFVRRSAANANGRPLMIVLDNSFSMRAGTRFADAKREALALLAAKPHSQRAQVIALGGQVQVLTQPITDAEQLRVALDGVQVGDGYGSYGELGKAVRALSETEAGPIDLHLFSDMQRSAMPASFADAVFPQTVELTLHNVAKTAPSPNWTVESVNAPADLTDTKDTSKSRVQAVVAGMGTDETVKTVSLMVNGKEVAKRSVKVPANGRATVEFAPLNVGYGFNRCEVRVNGGDVLPADDASFFVVRRLDPQHVLFVHNARDERSPLYFGAALNAASHGAFVVQAVAADQATDIDPKKFAFTVLSDAATLPSIFEHSLEQYVASGGDVLIAAGVETGRRGEVPLWGGEHVKPRNVTASVGQVDFTYPALEQTEPGRDNGGWAAARFFYIVPVDTSLARVVARLSDGTPLLLERQMGEGRVLLLASGLENLTNDLPLHPVFVAFVDKASRYLAGGEELSGAKTVDSFVQLRSSAETQGRTASAEVVDPDGRRPLSLSEGRTARTFRLTRAGFYQIRFANGRSGEIGVNADRRESDLTPMSAEMQGLWTGSHGGQNAAEKKQVLGTNDRRMGLWWYVMLLALAVAVAETALSSRYLGVQREEV
ncbi:MAG: BatA and WFA domain-containing protein [Acidobacteria bacterium]|nr:BatA and WFA domain-containing protein [Acidobacteriota bacterium]